MSQLNVADRSCKTRRWLRRVIGDDGAEVGRELVARPPLIVQLTAATAPAYSSRCSRGLMHHRRRLGPVYHSSDESTHHRRTATHSVLCITAELMMTRVTFPFWAPYTCIFYYCYVNSDTWILNNNSLYFFPTNQNQNNGKWCLTCSDMLSFCTQSVYAVELSTLRERFGAATQHSQPDS